MCKDAATIGTNTLSGQQCPPGMCIYYVYLLLGAGMAPFSLPVILHHHHLGRRLQVGPFPDPDDP